MFWVLLLLAQLCPNGRCPPVAVIPPVRVAITVSQKVPVMEWPGGENRQCVTVYYEAPETVRAILAAGFEPGYWALAGHVDSWLDYCRPIPVQ